MTEKASDRLSVGEPLTRKRMPSRQDLFHKEDPLPPASPKLNVIQASVTQEEGKVTEPPVIVVETKV